MDKLNILIVEDESLVALQMSDFIRSLGYNVVDYATNAKMAKDIINLHTINLIIMDINLGDAINGIELYKSFKENIPVIYITAYKDEDHIQEAIPTNPIGYLIKPLNENELNALLKLAHYKIFQKTIVRPKKMFILGDGYAFDIKKEKLFFHDLFINLSKKELQLLKLLIEANGQIVSFETITDEIWQDKIISSSSLRMLIYRLRAKLEYKFIENEFNYGIKLTILK